jgi:phenylalanyl-tRNA synthetase beta chain
MRPINNIVDATNYVLLEYGQPLHAFDYNKLKGGKIIVRRAEDGEAFTTLDNVERKLSKDTLVIADDERVVAIAGVMGGANSEVDGDSTTILLESASFNPSSIHYTSHNLRLGSEASTRFERGISREMALPALKRTTQLILDLAGGKAAVGVVDEYPGKKPRKSILVSSNTLKTVMGTKFNINQAGRVLKALGFTWMAEMEDEYEDYDIDGEIHRAFVPYWRTDIETGVDVAEEVARIIGYDKIPLQMMPHPLPHQKPNPMIAFKRYIRLKLAGYGFQEVVTYSLTSGDVLDKLRPGGGEAKIKPIKLANPLSSEQECLRTSLRGNILLALASNRRHEEGAIRLFELGRVYRQRKAHDLPYEPEMLSVALSRSTLSGGWLVGEESFDFYYAKGLVEVLLESLGISADYQIGEDEGLRPGIQAFVLVENMPLGVIGELHPKVAHAFEIEGPVYIFELNLTALQRYSIGYCEYQPVPRYPAIVRDIAVVVDSIVTHKQMDEVINDFSLVSCVELFDVYTGKQVAEGKKSLAYRLTFQSPDHTLTDEDADKIQQKILEKLSSTLGATLRS